MTKPDSVVFNVVYQKREAHLLGGGFSSRERSRTFYTLEAAEFFANYMLWVKGYDKAVIVKQTFQEPA